MKFTLLIILALCLPVLAEKPARPAPAANRPASPFFKPTGEPYELEKPFPGITAALVLSDQQKTAMTEAYQQTVRNPGLRGRISVLERNPDAPEAQRKAVRDEMEKARADLRQRIATILTPEQSALAIKIQDAAVAAEHEANDIFRAEFEAAKIDPAKLSEIRAKARTEAEDLLVQKLEKFLTPAQMQAIQKSAGELRAADDLSRKALR